MWLKFFLAAVSCTVQTDEKGRHIHKHSNEQNQSFVVKLFVRSFRFAAFNIWSFIMCARGLHAKEKLDVGICVRARVCKLSITMTPKKNENSLKTFFMETRTSSIKLLANVQRLNQLSSDRRCRRWGCCCCHHHTIRIDYAVKRIAVCVNGHTNVALGSSFFLIFSDSNFFTWASLQDNTTSAELFHTQNPLIPTYTWQNNRNK